MNDFYSAVNGVLFHGMLMGVVSVALLMAVLFRIQMRDSAKYDPKGKPTRIAYAVSVYFFAISYTVYGIGKRDLVIARESCPVAQRLLVSGEAGSLQKGELSDIVLVCGVDFFEKHSGMKWSEVSQ